MEPEIHFLCQISGSHDGYYENRNVPEAESSSVFKQKEKEQTRVRHGPGPDLRLAQQRSTQQLGFLFLSLLPEDGGRSRFRNVAILLKYRRWTTTKKCFCRLHLTVVINLPTLSVNCSLVTVSIDTI
jgi:hypothetical protein